MSKKASSISIELYWRSQSKMVSGISVAFHLFEARYGARSEKFWEQAIASREVQLVVSSFLAGLSQFSFQFRLCRPLNEKTNRQLFSMLELLQRLKPPGLDSHITDDIAKLAAREREVRTLEMLIEYISTLDDEELARAWPRLIGAIYSTPKQRETSGPARTAERHSMPHEVYAAYSPSTGT